MANFFISYARSPLDERVMQEIRALLTRFGLSCWWDGMLASQRGIDLNVEIAAELDSADTVLFLASSQSMASPYCQAEIAYALERDKRILRINLEPISAPAALLPLWSVPTIDWHGISRAEREQRFASKLAQLGVALVIDESGEPLSAASEDDPNAAIIRPPYKVLATASADKWREYMRRLTVAVEINPANGHNHLSLALLWLVHRDGDRALTYATRAVNLLGREPDAHYGLALALCISITPTRRSRDDVENILQRLAIARRLPAAGAHVDLLSALVIAHYYLPRYLTPPANPDELLIQGLTKGLRFDISENQRVLDLEHVANPSVGLDPNLIARYQKPL